MRLQQESFPRSICPIQRNLTSFPLSMLNLFSSTSHIFLLQVHESGSSNIQQTCKLNRTFLSETRDRCSNLIWNDLNTNRHWGGRGIFSVRLFVHKLSPKSPSGQLLVNCGGDLNLSSVSVIWGLCCSWGNVMAGRRPEAKNCVFSGPRVRACQPHRASHTHTAWVSRGA